jgi:hypothetical protein
LERKITKKIGKIGKVVLWVVGILIALDLLIVGIVCLPPVQTAIVEKVTSALSRKMQSEFFIKHIYITPTLRFIGIDVTFKDHKSNKMIYVPYIKSRITSLSINPFKIYFGATTVRHAEVTLQKYSGEERVNIAMWAEHLKNPDKKTRSLFLIHFDYIDMEESRFLYQNENVKLDDNQGIMDYGFFELKDMNLKTADFNLENLAETFEIRAFITQISLKQYTGFELSKLSGRFRINQFGLTLAGTHIVTPNSNAYLDFALHYNDWSDYSNFVDSVRFDAQIHPSMVNIKDVARFAPKLRGMDNRIALMGNIHGQINALKIENIFACFGSRTWLKGDLEIDDVVSERPPACRLTLNESNLDMADLAFFKLPQDKSLAQLTKLNGLANVKADGYFHGTVRDFDTRINLISNIGNAEIALSSKTQEDKLLYQGKVTSVGLNLGALLHNQKLFNQVALNVRLQASLPNKPELNIKSLQAQIDANVSHLDFGGHRYQDIEIESQLKHKKAKAKIISHDVHCDFSLDGLIDLTPEKPLLDVALSLQNIDLTKLFTNYNLPATLRNGLDKAVAFLREKPNMTLSASEVAMRLSGHKIDNVNGYIAIDGLSITQAPTQQSPTEQQPLKVSGERLRLTVINTSSLHKYNFVSSLFNASLTTNYALNELADSLIGVAYRYLPNFLPARPKTLPKETAPSVTQPDDEKYMDFAIETYRIRSLLAMFMPELRIAPRSSVYFHNDSKSQSISADVPQITLQDRIRVYGLKVKGENAATDNFVTDVHIDTGTVKMGEGQFAFKDIDLTAHVGNNRVNYSLSWFNPENISTYSSSLSGDFEAIDNQNIVASITHSSIFIKDKEWQFKGRDRIVLGKENFVFDEVKLVSDESSIELDGAISQNMEDNLKINARHMDMSLINKFTDNMKMHFEGDASAEFIYAMLPNRQRVFTGRACVSDFIFNDASFGNLFAVAAANTKGAMGFSGGIFLRDEPVNSTMIDDYSVQDFRSEPRRMADLKGYYLPDKKIFTVNGDIDTLNIGFLAPFFSAFSQHISGMASGDLTFVAKPDSIYFDGTVIVQNARMGIKALNTIYTIQNQIIEFDQSGIKFDNVILKDRDKNEAYLSGTVFHHNFKDFKLNLNVETERIMALNAPRSSDVYFYGDGFVAGHVSIVGDAAQLNFKASNLRTLPGTMFYLPLTFSEKVSETQGIRFKINTESATKQQEASSMILDMDFIFNITKDAVVNLILDPSIGGSVRATAIGPLRVGYNTSSELQLNGDLTLVSGEFILALKDILNRRLTLMPGGIISFNGPVDNSRITLQAVHTANNVSLTDILPNDMAGLARSNRVNAYLNLNGSLFDPTIGFSFSLPNSNNEINSILMSAIDTTNPQNSAKQFFALLLTDRFLPQNNNNDAGNMVISNTLENTGVAMMSGVIGNILSQNLKFAKIGVNYKIADELYAAEYGGNVTIPLFNNRAILETNLNYADNKNVSTTTGNFMVDFNFEYMINEEGNWRFKLFNFNDQYSLDNLTTRNSQGVGVSIIFRQEFNNNKDFIANYRRKKNQTKDKK